MTKETEFFVSSAAVYDLLYAEKNTDAEVEWVASELRKNGVGSGGRILEIGSGTGRHAHGLAAVGFSVTGVEPSTEMLDRATEGANVNFIHGDGRRIRVNSTFDAVLALFHVVSYQVDLTDAHDFFATAAAHLTPGGIFCFDVWFSPAVHALRPESRVLELSSEELSVTRRAVPVEDVVHSLVNVHYTYALVDIATGKSSEFAEIHPMRHFSYSEIHLLATVHGFEILGASEFLTGEPPSRDTWGVWFVLRKA